MNISDLSNKLRKTLSNHNVFLLKEEIKVKHVFQNQLCFVLTLDAISFQIYF